MKVNLKNIVYLLKQNKVRYFRDLFVQLKLDQNTKKYQIVNSHKEE